MRRHREAVLGREKRESSGPNNVHSFLFLSVSLVMTGPVLCVFFIFVFFKKNTEIYFWFQVLHFYPPTARQGGGRGPTARPGGGRDLYVNKNKFILRRGPWREPAAPLPGGRPPAAPHVGGRGAAGSLLKYKIPPLPSAPSFSAHEIQRGERVFV